MFKLDIVFVLLLASFTFGTLGYKIGKKVVKLDRYDACVEPPDSPLTLTYMKIDFTKTAGSYLNGEARLTKHIPKIRISCNFTRCANRESLDTCEQFTKLEPADTCMLTNMRNTAWSGLVYGFHPPFYCPLQKGTFHIINASFDANLLNFLPFEDCTEYTVIHVANARIKTTKINVLFRCHGVWKYTNRVLRHAASGRQLPDAPALVLGTVQPFGVLLSIDAGATLLDTGIIDHSH
ncbi:hypothetical protein CBL_03864 [Carabus blaptoides fortunei]